MGDGATRMCIDSRKRPECTLRPVVSTDPEHRYPTLHAAVRVQPAGMESARAGVHEGAAGRRGLALSVPSPAGDAAVGLHGARMGDARADAGERSGGRAVT